MMAGGFKPPQDATEEVQQVLDSVKGDLAAHLPDGTDTNSVTAMAFSTQVVAGVIYLIKARCGEESGPVIHVKIIKPLPHTNQPPGIMAVAHEGINAQSDLIPI